MKKCLHRDVACRNCLLDENQDRVKLSDFGLSKQGNFYKIPKEENTPIRWAAPEVLSTAIYTAKSDIYSYGILVWEIFHHAERPYGDIPNKVIREKIADPQFRPAINAKLPKEVKYLMEYCWKAEPERRPTIATVVAYIRSKARKR
ncbi:Protein kinase domain-containing protein [Trichostrongylus colubriformis]|uniref:Protein kinase domain-containing protein n=1 Tax=Trichostrongylus colubriformis TaxID=6319 RepID=A0AAN8IEN8_TRICO